MSTSNSHVRSMKGWWLKHPFYIKYMVRESTSIFVVIYALVLLSGLWNLSRGEAAYAGWLEGLSHPVSILFHLLALAAAGYHTITWFKVSPKVVPHLYIGTSRIPDGFISGIQYAIAAACYLVLLLVAGLVQ